MDARMREIVSSPCTFYFNLRVDDPTEKREKVAPKPACIIKRAALTNRPFAFAASCHHAAATISVNYFNEVVTLDVSSSRTNGNRTPFFFPSASIAPRICPISFVEPIKTKKTNRLVTMGRRRDNLFTRVYFFNPLTKLFLAWETFGSRF